MQRSQNSLIRKVFQTLVDRKQVEIKMDVLNLILTSELQVSLEGLDAQLVSALPLMLIVYIRNWPGWQKSKEYYSGKLNFRDWFLKFRQYIIVKINFIIKNGYKEVMGEINVNKASVGVQTEKQIPKGFAPFCISIKCSPKEMASLVFTDRGDDIIMSRHAKYTWTGIGFKELLNWPHVGVEFVSHELSFKRFNRGEFTRSVNLTSCLLPAEKPLNFIEEIKLVDARVEQKCYSLNVIWAYVSQLLQILRTYKKTDPETLAQIETVVQEFLLDVKEWDLNDTVATNTSVLFNIGSNVGSSYFLRNKKVNKPNSRTSNCKAEVGYSELYIPKMETQLTCFNGTQDYSSSDISFVGLNTMQREFAKGSTDTILQPVLIFSCLFCLTKHGSHATLLSHIEHEHGMEPNFACPNCLRPINLDTLARLRWKHVCGASE